MATQMEGTVNHMISKSDQITQGRRPYGTLTYLQRTGAQRLAQSM